MNRKFYSYLIILAMLAVVLVLYLVNRSGQNRMNDAGLESVQPTTPQEAGFNRKVTRLEYTQHAKCRMQCRHISPEEVMDILKNGRINTRKSDLADKPCPTYALEGITRQDHQHVRIVFAQCVQKMKVVTCIDLENEFACDCK